MSSWKTFVYEATSPPCTHAGDMENCDCEGDRHGVSWPVGRYKGNPIVKLHICRYCGASDNEHDPHIPDEYKNSVSYESCSRCGFSMTEEEGD